MDYSSEANDLGTEPQPARTEGDFRVSYESQDERADLETVGVGPVRHPYWIHQCQPVPYYRGLLDCMEVEEARALFAEMFDRFYIFDSFRGFPLPPKGLPGFAEPFNEDDPAAKLIEIGVQYVLAIVRNERRAMHLRWQDAEAFIRKIKDEAEERVYLDQAHAEMAECQRKDAAPQFVYFIGAENGPVKIGFSTKPSERLRSLQTGRHERLSILAQCSGSLEMEKSYHQRFKAHRLNGEWFARVPEIEAEIERLSAQPL